ncbi:MAG: hypothetical protein K0R12_310 [Gammaproteobacteria bacterium]|jgi:MSHA biogenesis protein MshJ|nr:hypothetical protein [Gammaproteobacteria bacterium]
MKNTLSSFPFARVLQKSLMWMNARNPREQLTLFFGALIAVVMLWNMLLYKPLQVSIKKKQVEIRDIKEQVEKMDIETQNVLQELERIGNTSEQESTTRENLAAQSKKLEEALGGIKSDLISPQQMIAALREMLNRQQGLQLLSLDTVPAQAVGAADKQVIGADGQTMPGIYEHTITLVLLGDYFSVLNYLRSLDSLDWRLFWDRMDYKVVEYPKAQVTIKLHTFSAEKGFISGR